MFVAHHFGYSAVTAQLTVSEAGTDGGGEAVARLSEGAWMATATVAEKELAAI